MRSGYSAARWRLVTMPFLLVPVIETYGWQAMLVGCGALGAVVTIPLLYLFVFDRPRDAPWMSEVETQYIERNLEQDCADACRLVVFQDTGLLVGVDRRRPEQLLHLRNHELVADLFRQGSRHRF